MTHLKRRIASVLLAACLLIGLLPTSALAAEPKADTGVFTVIGGEPETDYTYSGPDPSEPGGAGVLTVKTNTELTISTNNATESPANGRIVIETNVKANITLAGLNIKPADSSTSDGCSGIDLGNGATLDITLQSGSSNVINGGKSSTAGTPAPGIHVPEDSTLTITGNGSLAVHGASDTYAAAVGIGGMGSSSGAGGTCGNVIILGGTITVHGGTSTTGSAPVDIGGGATDNGNGGDCSTVIILTSVNSDGNLEIGGGAGATVGGGKGSDGAGIKPTGDGTYTVYGDLTLPCNITIPEGATVTIPDGASLTVPKSTTLTNSGTILVQGGTFTNNGTVSGNQPTYPSKVTVSVSQDGKSVASVPYGSTVTITATMEKVETAANVLSADTGKVDFYLGDANDTTGIKLDTGTVEFKDGAYTASVEVTLDDEKGVTEVGTITITADFGGYAPEGDEGGDSLAPNTGSAELTVTKAEQSAPTGTFFTTSSTENSITVTFTDVTQPENENGIEIAYAVGPTASEPTSDWTTATKSSSGSVYTAEIENLSPGSPYIFFARYKGDDTHEPSPAIASSSAFYTKPKINTTSLPNAYVGVEYSKKLEAVAAEGVAVSWTITSGTLPAGLTLNSDGTITGTPTTPTTQAANFTVNATIGEGASSIFTTQVLTISVTKSDAELGGLTISGNTGIAEGAFQYGDTITVTFTPERKTETNTNSLAENTATLTYTPTEGAAVELATATAQSDGSFELSYDTKEKKLPIGENLTLTVSYGGSGALNPVEKELTVTLEQAILKNMPTVTGSFVYGETLTVNYTKQDDESVTYQWYRGGEKISDATENSYTLTAEDISKNIYVIVSATDEWHRGAMQSRQQEVAKAQGSIEIACDSVTYGEPVQPSVASNTNTGADVAYSYAGTGSTSYGPSNEAPENAGTYTVTATVAETATHTAAESEPVAFTIRKASQTAPAAPTEARTTTSSITLNAISANENGAAAEYGISTDGGMTWTWQSGPEFDDLSSNTTYQFAARYAETDNYAASAPSDTVSIATDRRSSGGSSSSSSKDEGPSTGDSDGWKDIQDEIADAEGGDTITIDMNGETEVPGEIFEEVAGKDVDVEIDLGGGVSWTVNGQDVPEGVSLSDLDLGVSMDTKGIPANVFKSVSGEYSTVQFTLAHDGAFGFALTLTAPLGRENAGYWANLYYYNERGRELEFITSARIARDGSAALRLEHASQYAVVIDDESHEPVELPFTDVPEGYWAYDAIRYVYGEGLMAGTSADAFSPDATTTRGQIVTILWRLSGSPVVNYLMDYSDVSLDSYYAEAVRWATSEGIVGGYGGGLFGPDDAITREQLAAILYRYAQYEGYDTTQGGMAIREYADYEQISDFALEALDWAVSAGIISGTSATTLSPSGSATRAQVAVILMRFCQDFVNT